jgi:hypothetical protein
LSLAVITGACLILSGILAAQGGKPQQSSMGAVGITVYVEANFQNWVAHVPAGSLNCTR